MGGQYNNSGNYSGFQYENNKNKYSNKDDLKFLNGKDEDLVIEENTIYEIDRDCFEKLKKMKKRRV